ncbi:hypothetical protein MOO44_06160 [Nicoliella spurrieriana]|uniref:Uncharacterized protein n=1 Tax=Nicoliella spurrieriana TaxID=2925830 RepID=A0A976X575_9LACO|nr:hypothetical protein [Nicoliella spurrieriana]UQS86474.1 hypothetical protein MOO44_06160 [Nicoliella spurrieriana]
MDNQSLWQSIYQNLDAHHYLLAINDLKKIYKDDPSLKVNQILVKTLFNNGDYLAAKEYLLERINDYQNSEEDFKLMINIFKFNHNFVQAQIIINSIRNKSFKLDVQNDFNHFQADYKSENDELINKLENDLFHIGGKKLSNQQIIITESMNLPVSNYFDGAQGALLDPFLYPAIRFNILDILRELQINQSINIKWIDKKAHSINPIDLLPLAKTKSAVNIFSIINSMFGQQSPIVFQNMLKTFSLFLAYLYPFNDDVITDYSRWVEVAYQLQIGNQIDLHHCDEDYRLIYEWQLRLLKMVDSIK